MVVACRRLSSEIGESELVHVTKPEAMEVKKVGTRKVSCLQWKQSGMIAAGGSHETSLG